jgi:outer membrane protein
MGMGSRAGGGLLLLLAALGSARARPTEAAARPTEAAVPPTEAAVRRVTLAEALAYARAHQPAVRTALARIGARRADTAVSRAQWLPRVGASAQVLAATGNNSTASFYNTPWAPVPRVGATKTQLSPDWTPYPSTFVAVGLGQEVYDFGRIAAQAAVADAGLAVERHQADVTRLEVGLLVRETFYALQAAHAVQEAAKQARARARVHRDWAQAGVRGGLRAPIELTRADADLAAFEVSVIRAVGGVRTARSAFAAAVGVPDLELEADGKQPAFPPVPALDEALRQAAANDPTLKAALGRIREQEAATRAVAAQLRPELLLAASVSGREGGAPSSSGEAARFHGWLPDVPNYSVGLVLSWPLYDGTVAALRRASRAREEVRRAELSVRQQLQVTAVQRAVVDVEVAHSALAGLARAQEAALANYDQAEARFRAGLGNAVELADAEALRTQAEIDLAIGRFEVWRAAVVLDRLMGRGR